MENSKLIKISLTNDNFVDLSSDTPDVKYLMDKIVELKDKIVVDKIVVECSDPSFDKIAFEKIIKNSVKEYLKLIEINKENFHRALMESDFNDNC